MKTALKIVLIAVAVIAVILTLLGFALRKMLTSAMTAIMVPEHYTETVQTGGAIEAKYLAMGSERPARMEKAAPEPWGKHVIYYPQALEGEHDPCPVVVFVNGTGVTASRYPALFEHLASWGFIVLGNEDPSTCTGASADATLACLLSENEDPASVLYRKADLTHIGIVGHSQGGVGVFNAINTQEHKALYQCAVSLSPTEEEMAAALGMPYDSAQTAIPTLLLAAQTNDVISPDKLSLMFRRIAAPKAMALKPGRNHGEMLYCADGYVTAWFTWHLQGDQEAAKAFVGNHAELMENPLYTGQQLALTE